MKNPAHAGFFIVLSLNEIRKLNLIGVELHPGMIHIELLNLLNGGKFVVDKHLQVDVAQQIKVHLVTVVPDGHNERAILIEKADLLR